MSDIYVDCLGAMGRHLPKTKPLRENKKSALCPDEVSKMVMQSKALGPLGPCPKVDILDPSCSTSRVESCWS